MPFATITRHSKVRLEQILLPLAIMAVAVIGWMSYKDSSARQRSRVEANRLQQILYSNQGILSLLKDLEVGQRGFLLTGDRTHLDPYQHAKANLPSSIDGLGALVRREDQRVRVNQIRTLIAEKTVEVEATLMIREQMGEAAALEVVRSNRGKQTMDTLRQLSEDISNTAYGDLQTVTQDLEEETARSRKAILAACAVLVGLLAFSLFLIRRASMRREDLIDRLEDSRLRILTTLASIGDGVITADSVGLVTYLNPVAAELTGMQNKEDGLGKAIEQVFPLESETAGCAMENPVRRVLRNSTIATLDNPAFLVRPDGTRIVVDDSAAPIFDHEHQLAGVVMVFRDITQKKLADDVLKRWQHVFQHAGFGMAILRLDGAQPYFDEVNPTFAEMHGYTEEELKGGLLSKLVMPESWEMEATAVTATKRAITESVHVRKDGSRFPVLADVTVVRDASGKASYCTAYYSDISERKRIEEDIRWSEEQYRVTADALAQLVWTSRPDGSTEYMNVRWQEQTGLSQEATGEHGWSQFLHPEDRERCMDAWKKSVETGETFLMDCRIQTSKEASPRWHTCRAIAVRDRKGQILRWFGSCTDDHDHREAANSMRTGKEELEKLNQALLRSNQDLEQFAYVASHDLQEPLRMVIIYSQLLKEEFADQLEGQAKEYMEFAVNGAQRMEALLKDLLAYSRVTSQEENLIANADSETALKMAITNLKLLIEEVQAQIHHSPLPSVAMAEIHLVQLFQNLLNNALKYRKSNVPPIINIEAEESDGMWIFKVSDNGIGIALNYQEQIFRIFGRLHGQDQPGTGIGLALCKKLIERNGGRLWVESKLGEGSTFLFSVPTLGRRV